jgi:hypothetical protein
MLDYGHEENNKRGNSEPVNRRLTMNQYAVRFSGTAREIVIQAETMKEAKMEFAKREGVSLSSYITARKAQTWEAR